MSNEFLKKHPAGFSIREFLDVTVQPIAHPTIGQDSYSGYMGYHGIKYQENDCSKQDLSPVRASYLVALQVTVLVAKSPNLPMPTQPNQWMIPKPLRATAFILDYPVCAYLLAYSYSSDKISGFFSCIPWLSDISPSGIERRLSGRASGRGRRGGGGKAGGIGGTKDGGRA